MADKDLIDLAEKAMQKGYDPYSGFYVGCAVKTKSGNIYIGANINTCSYEGLCAERIAIGSAISKGDYEINTISIIAKSDFFDVKILSGPCGACRQMIYEFADLASHDINILISDTKKAKVLKTSIFKIHPYGFGPRFCGGKTKKYLTSRH